MKFRQIEAFRYIMLRGTTAAAAAEMHITQPAVSRLIKDLEVSLGFMLFERSANRLIPTPEANQWFKSVEESFLGLEKLAAVADKIRHQAPSELKIACTSAIGTSLVPLAIKEHRRYFPDEHFAVFTHSVSEMVIKLQNHAIDLAVGLPVPQLPGIVQEELGQARYVFAARDDHPLMAKELVVIEDLVDQSVLTVINSDPNYWSALNHVLDPIEDKIRRHIGIDTSHTAYAMIEQGLAVGVLEPFAARTWQTSRVATRPFEPEIRYPYGLAYSTNAKHHTSLSRFIESLQLVAKTMQEFD